MTSNINDDKKNLFYKKGLCGLTNLGNTCFMNTIIQCINSNRDLAELFLSDLYKKHLNTTKIDRVLVDQWALLSKGLWNKNCVITPTSFHRCVQLLSLRKGYGGFSGYNQNDSQEFLQYFLETMHNGLSREVTMTINGTPKTNLDKLAIKAYEQWSIFFKDDYSPIIDYFYGQLYSVITTIDDLGYISETFDPFSNLSLEIPDDATNIYDCLDHYTKKEPIDDHKNSDDDTKTYFKQLKFWSMPNYLIIFLKKYTNNNMKITTLIDFPLENLDIKKYCAGYNKDTYIYDLHAVANHGGNTLGGHYWAYTKNLDGNWYKYNDKFVSLKPMENVVTKNAYCLFYKKHNLKTNTSKSYLHPEA